MSYPPQPGYGAPGGYPPGGYAGPPPSNGMATGALVTGLISALCLPVLFIVAIPLGFLGLSKAKQLNGVGRGQALGGLIAGFVGLLWCIGLIILLVAGAFAADDIVDDAACSLDRTLLRSSVESFQIAEGRDPADEAELVTEGYLTNEVETYDFTISNGNVELTAVSGEGCD
jgi:competence protein ComGC